FEVDAPCRLLLRPEVKLLPSISKRRCRKHLLSKRMRTNCSSEPLPTRTSGAQQGAPPPNDARLSSSLARCPVRSSLADTRWLRKRAVRRGEKIHVAIH